ncbi:MAG TPA: hypothetical protein VK135_01745 [Candidatus Dormibacteraeota bacterium]|nr:hypothetical protein [Virgibacillus sp. MSJ-26]MBU5468391.1 hypothetical protein [Virgibacillus sp. MSJ-26]HLQ97391.1 hypothetical protein [Candidatus Dormibacteraeota bacterium]
MINKSEPPAEDRNQDKGLKRNKNLLEQEKFTDANRKRKESDDHTVGGF